MFLLNLFEYLVSMVYFILVYVHTVFGNCYVQGE